MKPANRPKAVNDAELQAETRKEEIRSQTEIEIRKAELQAEIEIRKAELQAEIRIAELQAETETRKEELRLRQVTVESLSPDKKFQLLLPAASGYEVSSDWR